MIEYVLEKERLPSFLTVLEHSHQEIDIDELANTEADGDQTPVIPLPLDQIEDYTFMMTLLRPPEREREEC